MSENNTPLPLPPLCERYLRQMLTVRNLSEKTIRAYRLELTLWNEYLATHTERNVVTATKDDVKDYLEHCRIERGNKAATARRKLAVLKAFYKWALRDEKIAVSPADPVELPKLPQTKAIYLKDHEARRLLEAILEPPNEMQAAEAWARTWLRDLTMIHLMIYHGLRIQEVVNLDWRDVDFEDMSFLVRGKGRKERRLSISQQTYPFLQRLYREGPTSEDRRGPVFVATENPNPNAPAGKRLSDWSARYAVEKYVNAAALSRNITPHKLRHTFATALLNKANANIREIADLLGHESLETTKIYTHTTSERHRTLIDTVDFNS